MDRRCKIDRFECVGIPGVVGPQPPIWLQATAPRTRPAQILATCSIPSCITIVQMFCHPFQVDEVFRCIVEQLVARSPRSALSLAMCCKSLTDLSLSVLWERQKRLSTLIKVLPPDAWTYQETDSYAGELVGRPRSHRSFRPRCSLLRSLDDLTGYHIAGMGKVEEVRVVDARTRISRG